MYNDLINNIENKTLILFGELHGTKVIPEFLYGFIIKIIQKKKINLCLEIPSELQPEMNSFMKKYDETLLDILKAEDSFRYSSHYLEFLKKLRKHRNYIKVHCIESESFSQEGKDKGLAKSIFGIMKNKKFTIAYMGDLHASKNKLFIGKMQITPTGFLLKKELGDSMISIRFTLKDKERKSKEEVDFNKGFDYIIEI